MKQKLSEKCGSNLHLTSKAYQNIIMWKKSPGNIRNNKWYKERHENIEDEKERLFLMAARLIEVEIRELSEFNREFFPKNENVASEEGEKWHPRSFGEIFSCHGTIKATSY